MKKIIPISLLCAAALISRGQFLTNSYTLTPGTPIQAGNPVGVTEYFNVSGLAGAIEDVQLQLNVSGGFNGDLYAYLEDPFTDMAILLNRVGISATNSVGSSDSGLNLTLDSSGNNIHYYQNQPYSLDNGQLTGAWQADGRNISPASSGAQFDAASPDSGLNVFDSADPNGTWTFFIADVVDSGSSPNLDAVTLDIITTPEPGACALLGGALLLWAELTRRRAK